MNDYAPIVLFVYARPEHTKKTLAALKENKLADRSELFIFSDGPKGSEDEIQVKKVREIIREQDGFKRITIMEKKYNIGLADNIIEGVTHVVRKYGKVIVLEDDIVTSPYFLLFMNDSLEMYQGNPKVMSISGCNYPVDLSELKLSTYFLRIPLCWGWATWDNRWALFKKKIQDIDKIDKETIKYINFDGHHDYFAQARLNAKGKLNTWFIFWYIASAKRKALTLFPRFSLVENIGYDGSGENCGNEEMLGIQVHNKRIYVEHQDLIESMEAYRAHIKYFKDKKGSLLRRALGYSLKLVNRVVKNGS